MLTRRQSLALFATPLAASDRALLDEWRGIAADTDGKLGASALHLGTGRSASLNGGEPFALASVCKLPIAMHMLALVDEGRHKLTDEIEVLEQDVRPWVSDVARLWPKQRRFPLDQLIEGMVARSDNTAVDTLFRIGGGASALRARMKQWRIEGVRVDRPEGLCFLEAGGVAPIPPVEQFTPELFTRLLNDKDEDRQYQAMRRFLKDRRDTGTPDGTVQLLVRAYRGELLAKSTTTRLRQILEATSNGGGRLKGMLPPGTPVGHKTGTTASPKGFNGATNDVGVIAMPRGGEIAIAVYLRGSRRELAAREKIIARIAKAAFDSWS